MTASVRDRRALTEIEDRIRLLLPEDYQEKIDEIRPTPMRSAGLKFARDGRVAWNEMWGSFCDLAMAGGPPHKGALLEPADAAAMDAAPDRYDAVVHEICRGIWMVTDLDVDESPVRGWIRVTCLDEGMAGWLLRAIVVENVAVRAEGRWLDVPAGPDYRLEKEIKNVVTVVAKTCHYWLGHMRRAQQRTIAGLFVTLAEDSPLIVPALAIDDVDPGAADRIADVIQQEIGLARSACRYAGWLGLDCPSVAAAIFLMRALVVSNVLSRREDTTLFVPINPAIDPAGDLVIRALTRVHALGRAKGVLS